MNLGVIPFKQRVGAVKSRFLNLGSYEFNSIMIGDNASIFFMLFNRNCFPAYLIPKIVSVAFEASGIRFLQYFFHSIPLTLENEEEVGGRKFGKNVSIRLTRDDA